MTYTNFSMFTRFTFGEEGDGLLYCNLTQQGLRQGRTTKQVPALLSRAFFGRFGAMKTARILPRLGLFQ